MSKQNSDHPADYFLLAASPGGVAVDNRNSSAPSHPGDDEMTFREKPVTRRE